MPASNGSNQSSILNGLGTAAAPDTGALPASAIGSPKPDPNQPGNDVTKTAPNNQSQSVASPTNRALGVLKAIAAGQLPGVSVPTDAPKLSTDLTPDHLVSLGVGIYRPKSTGLSAVLFNQKTVPLSTVKMMDSSGTLSKSFPSITTFLGDLGADSKGSPSEDSAGPPGADAPSASDMNLTGKAPSVASVVPVLPRPGFGAAASRQAATARMKALGGTEPSARAVPGAGAIVNGLWAAPV